MKKVKLIPSPQEVIKTSPMSYEYLEETLLPVLNEYKGDGVTLNTLPPKESQAAVVRHLKESGWDVYIYPTYWSLQKRPSTFDNLSKALKNLTCGGQIRVNLYQLVALAGCFTFLGIGLSQCYMVGEAEKLVKTQQQEALAVPEVSSFKLGDVVFAGSESQPGIIKRFSNSPALLIQVKRETSGGGFDYTTEEWFPLNLIETSDKYFDRVK